MTPTEHAQRIAAKWVARLGLGFHPDTRGADYVEIGSNGKPYFTASEARQYDADMDRLFQIADPYEAGMNAWKAAGLL